MSRQGLASSRAGNDDELVELAIRNARAIDAGRCFIAFLREGCPLNVLNALKQSPEVCRIICATPNPLDVLVERHGLLRRIGCKL